jgi:hypothetical protein
VIEDRLRKRRVKSVDELSDHLGPYFIRHNAESTPTECENHELSLEFWTVARDGDGIPNTTSAEAMPHHAISLPSIPHGGVGIAGYSRVKKCLQHNFCYGEALFHSL